MKIHTKILSFLFLCFLLPSSIMCQENNDPYLWLEEIEGKKALDWVNTKNETTIEDLKTYPDFRVINDKILEILNSEERIAFPEIKGDYVYNFWNDEKNERGLWRRMLIKEYINGSSAWETVLDLDSLSEKEGEKWAFNGAKFLYPEFDLCMLRLSKGGSDAVVMREFDLIKKKFVEDSFYISEAKGSASWIDRNTLLVSTDFGEGTTTTSGYPRLIKIWKRGTPLSEASLLYEGDPNDVSVWGGVEYTPERKYIEIYKSITFFTRHVFILEGEKLLKLAIPDDAKFHGFFKNQMLIKLRSNWPIEGNIYNQGALIGIDYDEFLNGARNFDVIFEPDDRSSLVSLSGTENFLLLNRLTNVRSELHKYSFKDGKWYNERVDTPEYGTIRIESTDSHSDLFFFTYENFLTPVSLYYFTDNDKEMHRLKSLPHFFDENEFMIDQFEATSNDGTKIPYFVIFNKKTKFDGKNPTLLYAYGGFEIPILPWYIPKIGSAFLENGGIYVIANIRGGGEFGPKWHSAVLKENRQLAYDDFYAVSENLIQQKITSPKHLGIKGESNGGLLVGVAFTQRPDLYNAVICAFPLLDMKRYNKLLAGASWMAEYGDPDIPNEWSFIRKYSPYHNVVNSKKYPTVFFITKTRDDRVHPGHARKMAALMEDQGHKIFYFEDTEGGHGPGVTNKQVAFMLSLEYAYLLKMLK